MDPETLKYVELFGGTTGKNHLDALSLLIANKDAKIRRDQRRYRKVLAERRATVRAMMALED